MRKRFAHNRVITLSLFFASDKFDEISSSSSSFFVCFKNKDSVKEEMLK